MNNQFNELFNLIYIVIFFAISICNKSLNIFSLINIYDGLIIIDMLKRFLNLKIAILLLALDIFRDF